jgi:cathepsin L
MEEKFRLKIFVENKQKIAKHNMEFAAGNKTYSLRLNKYADMVSQFSR